MNFNRNGAVHTTALGGFVSIILKIMYIGYMAYLVTKLVNHDEDRTYAFEFNIEDSETIKDYRNLDMQIYHSLYHVNADGYSIPLFLTNETK